MGFREIRLSLPRSGPVAAWAVEIVSSTGLTVRCREPIAVEDLARLLRGSSC
jgi:hypothetical protein